MKTVKTAAITLLVVALVFVFAWWRNVRFDDRLAGTLPDGTYMRGGLLVDKGWRTIEFNEGLRRVRDTLWQVTVYYRGTEGKPVDTVYHTPVKLTENCIGADHYFGPEEDLLAYAERKGIRKFCYRSENSLNYFIRLKQDENYYLRSVRQQSAVNAMLPAHDQGWSRAIADEATWKKDTLVFGNSLCMSAAGIIRVAQMGE